MVFRIAAFDPKQKKSFYKIMDNKIIFKGSNE
jgi:hypothetical protein